VAQSSADDRADRAELWMLRRVDASSVDVVEDEEDEVADEEESSEFPGMEEEAETARGRRYRRNDAVFGRVLRCCQIVVVLVAVLVEEDAGLGGRDEVFTWSADGAAPPREFAVGWKASALLVPPP